MLTTRVDACASLLRGEPVLAATLDPGVLRRALRGNPLPPATTHVTVTRAMLDAVNEAGPIAGPPPPTERKKMNPKRQEGATWP